MGSHVSGHGLSVREVRRRESAGVVLHLKLNLRVSPEKSRVKKTVRRTPKLTVGDSNHMAPGNSNTVFIMWSYYNAYYTLG